MVSDASPEKKKKKTASSEKTTSPRKTVARKKAAPSSEKASPSVPQKILNHSDEDCRISVTFAPRCGVDIETTLTEDFMKKTYDEALRLVSKSISLPGFRKGKVPSYLVEKKHAEYVREEWKKLFSQKGFEKTLSLTKLQPANEKQVSFSLKDFNEKEAVLSFSFETLPVVPEIDETKISLKKIKRNEVSSERVDDYIEAIRLHQAKWNPVKERALQKEDFADIDIQNSETGEPVIEQKRVRLKKGHLSEWLIKLLTGMKEGETAEGTSKEDKLIPHEGTFHPMKCKVTVHSIFEAELPEADDAFARSVQAESMADLKTKVLLKLNADENALVDQEYKNQKKQPS